MSLLALYVLASLDASLAGYRDAWGRDARIFKGAYYRAAVVRGVLLGQLAAALGAGAFAAAYLGSADRPATLAAFSTAAWRMVLIYVPFAAVLFASMLLRLVPSVDVRSTTSVVVFGPLTLLRPLVILAGAAYGPFTSNRVEVVAVGAFVTTLTLLLEPVLHWRAERLAAYRLVSTGEARRHGER